MNTFENYTYYLPSYEECRAICDKYDNFQFYELTSNIDGYKVCTFNYRLTGYTDFLYPLGEDSDVKAFELRGISFVFNIDGSLHKRFILMNKFFNLNQVDETQHSLIKDIPIKSIYDKCDGSVINFITLPNGKILTKTKMCVDNIQALCSHEIFETDIEINKMVKWALSKDIMPIMEYVSPKNRVVLQYKKSELILLRFRDMNTGEYLELDTYPDVDKINTAVSESKKYNSWDDLVSLVETVIEKEGWVVTLSTGMMVKLKSKWYCDLHHLIDSICREDYLITKVLDEEIDDIIGQIAPDDLEVLSLIDNVIKVTTDYLHISSKKVENLVEHYNMNSNNRKDFVINYGKKDKYFGYTMAVLDGKETPLSAVIKDLKKYVFKLEQARSFIRKGDF